MMDIPESVIELLPVEEKRKTVSGEHIVIKSLKVLVEVTRHPLIVLGFALFFTYYVGEGIRRNYQTRQAKGNFSLRVEQLSFNRVFWLRNYVDSMKRSKKQKLSEEEVEYFRKKYIEAVEAWNTDLVSNLQLFDRYYPNEAKRKIFETEIHERFKEFHNILVALRETDNPPDINLDELSGEIDKFYDALRRFTDGLDIEFIK